MKKLLVLALTCGLFGCGNAGDGVLSMSTATATSDLTIVDADAINWVDSTGTKAAACAQNSVESIPVADLVNITVASIAAANAGTKSSPIRLDSATITYSPASSATPAMTSAYQILGVTLPSGGSVTVPIELVTQSQKASLQQALACTGVVYNYYARVTIALTEVGTGTQSNVKSDIQLHISDYIDK